MTLQEAIKQAINKTLTENEGNKLSKTLLLGIEAQIEADVMVAVNQVLQDVYQQGVDSTKAANDIGEPHSPAHTMTNPASAMSPVPMPASPDVTDVPHRDLPASAPPPGPAAVAPNPTGGMRRVPTPAKKPANKK